MRIKWEKGNRKIEFDSFSITLREVLVAIAAMALLFTIGIKISDAIERSGWEKSSIYMTAAQAKDANTYQWLVRTNIGNLLAEGVAECTDPVHIDGLDGDYWYIRREYQEYTRHTRRVAHTVSTGKSTYTYYTTEVYYTWDTKDTQSLKGTQFTFLGVTYKNGQIDIDAPWAKEVKVDEFEHNKRYVYYASDKTRTGVLFTNISNNEYTHSSFADGNTIESFLISHNDTGTVGKIVFWVCWIPMIITVVCIYIYIDNEYLED